MRLNLPNLLTLLRIMLIPLVVGVFYLPDATLSFESRNIAATAIFIVAALTDWLDGWLARRLNQTSAFGAFLDPVADKLMVAGALVVLLHFGRVHSFVALIIIGREIAISALREWMAQIGHSKSVAVATVGKLKTISQMIAIPLLLYYDTLFFPWLELDCEAVGTVLINIAAVLTVISMLYYLRKALPLLRKSA